MENIIQQNDDLKSQYIMLETEYKIIFDMISNEVRSFNKPFIRFKEIANQYKYPELLISMLDGEDYSELLMDIVKP